MRQYAFYAVWLYIGQVSFSFAQTRVCELSNLTITHGVLEPDFMPEKTSYTLTLPDNIPLYEIQWTPRSPCTDCSIIINEQNVAPGAPWSLTDNRKQVKIEITNTQKQFKTYYVFLNSIKPTLFSDENIKLKEVDVLNQFKRPRWMDKSGYVYATSSDTIFKSVDKGANWDPLYVVPDSLGGQVALPALIVSKTNRVIFCSNGKVLVSDENQKNFTTKYTFYKEGSPKGHLAHSMYDSIILLGTYQQHDRDTVEAIMSTDNGYSWKKIFGMHNPRKAPFHIHDIRYDPFSKRIIIATGDSRNSQLYYSDDLGNTWKKVFKNALTGNLYQTSQILAFPHGIVLGSDGPKDGLMYLPRKKEQDKDLMDEREKVNSNGFIKIDNSKALKRFAVRHWEMKRGNKSLYILPFYHLVFPFQKVASDYTRLWASFNGIEWYELYKWQAEHGQIFGFENIMGPYSEDKDNSVFSTFNGKFFKANILFPKELNPPQLLSPVNNEPHLHEFVFEWTPVGYALHYLLQISKDQYFTQSIVKDSSIVGNFYFFDQLSKTETYYWRVKALGFDGESAWSETQQFNTSDKENAVDTVAMIEPILYQNVPNPFNSRTTILYYIPAKSNVQLGIYNSLGKLMSLEYGLMEEGVFTKEISYEDTSQSGIYFAELRVTFIKSQATFRRVIKLLSTGNLKPDN